MANITLENISKSYGKVKALSNISIDIDSKEFIVLFGPAGAGKTTLLSIISGILNPDEGILRFDGEIVNELRPDERNVAMVFENYALYPHLTVYDNIAFPLRSPRYKEHEDIITKIIDKVTEKMHIRHLYDRFPAQLSNGQRQRVALGRALVRRPNVFLMDEPLAHLDAKLKNAMRTELKAIGQELNTTTIYVTHDYLEALSLGDRVVIIDQGKIIQIGTPDQIYYQPYNIFVAKLVGEPEINLFQCKLEERQLIVDSGRFCWQIAENVKQKLSAVSSDKFLVGIRASDIAVTEQETPGFRKGSVMDFYSIGNRFVVQVESDGLQFNTLVPGSWELKVYMDLYCSINEKALLLFDAENQNLLTVNS